MRFEWGRAGSQTCPYGEEVECRGCGKDGFSPPVFMGAGYPREKRREGWVPACVRTRRGDGRILSCSYEGVAEHDEDGQPQGLSLRRRGQAIRGKTEGGMGPRICEDNGRGRAVREPPLRVSHRTSRRRATTRVAPTGTGMDSRLRRPLHNFRNAFRWWCGTTLVIAKSWDSGFRLLQE